MGRLNTHNTEPFPLLCAGEEQRAAQGLLSWLSDLDWNT